MTADTIWRWFCSLSEAELVDSAEPILELKLHADPAYGFEPLLIDDDSDESWPQLTLH